MAARADARLAGMDTRYSTGFVHSDVRRGVGASDMVPLGEQATGWKHSLTMTRASGQGLCYLLGGLLRVRPVVLLATCTMLGVDAGREASYSAQVNSITYPRASIYDGLPRALVYAVDAVVDNRLAANSMKVVRTALTQWQIVCERESWPEIIHTDDPMRGGKLAAFVMHLLADTEVVGVTIQHYTWGLRQWMQLQHQADPVMGVMHWREFMLGVNVLAHVPSEPRAQVPYSVMIQMATAVDLDSHWQVQAMFLFLVLMFTFSRSECPCPKSHEGEGQFDPEQHWMVRDIKIALVQNVYMLCIRFKRIKQDQRMERPGVRGDGRDQGASTRGGSDWVYVADVPGSPLSPFMWYRRLMSFYSGPRCETDPFFVTRDRQRPYLYSMASRDLQACLTLVGCLLKLGVHGLRVLGYNLSYQGNGEPVTVAHGGWKQGSNTRYHRFSFVRDVMPISRRMIAAGDDVLGGPEDDYSDDGEETVAITPRAVTRGGVTRDSIRQPAPLLGAPTTGAGSSTEVEPGEQAPVVLEATAVETVRGDPATAAMAMVVSPPPAAARSMVLSPPPAAARSSTRTPVAELAPAFSFANQSLEHAAHAAVAAGIWAAPAHPPPSLARLVPDVAGDDVAALFDE